jgi:uncharacterized membrane protein
LNAAGVSFAAQLATATTKKMGVFRMFRSSKFPRFHAISSVLILIVIATLIARTRDTAVLANPPKLYSRNGKLSVTLHAVIDSTGHAAFAFNGRPVAPILRAWPGDTIQID